MVWLGKGISGSSSVRKRSNRCTKRGRYIRGKFTQSRVSNQNSLPEYDGKEFESLGYSRVGSK